MRATAIAIALTLAGGLARAADIPVVGNKFLARTTPVASVSAKDPAVVAPAQGSTGDPTCTAPGGGGGTLEVRAGSDVGTWTLPCTNWVYNTSGTILRYRNRFAPAGGGFKVGKIKARLLSFLAKNLGDTTTFLVPSTPVDVSITVTTGATGAQRYCLRFPAASAVHADGRSYYAKDPGVAGTCPPPTTTTTTPTTVPGTTIPSTTTPSTTNPGTTNPGTTILGTTVPTTSTPATTAVSTTTSTTAGSTTTTLCNCCTATRRLQFTTGVPKSAVVTGHIIRTDGTTDPTNLTSGGLYVGGGSDTVPLPFAVPDMGVSTYKITTCSSGTGDYTIVATTQADVGGGPKADRTCSSGGGTNEYGSSGCLFGPPLALPNATNTPLSVCVVNRVQTDASGSGNCNDGSTTLNEPLFSDIYLAGDILPTVPGIQPCPICTGTPPTCNGGVGYAKNGASCTPGTSAFDVDYPTSHDCPPTTTLSIGTLSVPFALTTGSVSKTSTDIGTGSGQTAMFCGYCGNNTTATWHNPPVPCTANADCAAVPATCGPGGTLPCKTCRQHDPGAFKVGPARTITETGAKAGVCISDGKPHPATQAGVFCVPPTFTATLDAAADLPGPGAATLPGNLQFLP